MTDITRAEVEALLSGATPGKRVQFHGSYCKEAEGTPFTDWDTSHEMSVIRPDGSRYRLAHYKHASDAYLSQMAPAIARAYLAKCDDVDAAHADIDTLRKCAAEEMARAEAAEAEVKRLTAELTISQPIYSRRQLQVRAEAAEGILSRILYHDERGQGAGYSEALDEARALLAGKGE